MSEFSKTVEQIPDDQSRIKMRKFFLAFVGTVKKVSHNIESVNQRFHSTICYKVLTRTTQPAHLVALLIASIVVSILWPNLVHSSSHSTATDSSGSGGSSDDHAVGSSSSSRKYTTLMYLGVFATHFGTQMWMTFVSGLSLYFNLPRHLFGECQKILFPRYFAINSFLSLVALITFVKVQSQQWALSTYVQVVSLTLCAIIELTVRLYLAPTMLQLLCQKYRMEMSQGSGKEIGKFDFKGLLERNATFKIIHTRFRKYHTIIAMANLVSVVCTFVHLHYLASKIVSI